MRRVRGIAASPGIAIGTAFVCTEEKPAIPRYDIRPQDIDHEFNRFQSAIRRASEELETLKRRVRESGTGADESLLESQLLMVNDPQFAAQVEKGLKKELKNIEWVVVLVIEEMTNHLQSSSDDTFRDRSFDFHDISRRIIGHLLNKTHPSFDDLSDHSIVVAHNLMPSDAISLAHGKARGIITEVGGKTSHTAIIARSLEIPAVLGCSHIIWNVDQGDEIIVDGHGGTVIINPDRFIRERYEKKKSRWDLHEKKLHDLTSLPAQTLDGRRVQLEANIEVPEEVDSVLAHGADGIGLYRSEFLYIKPHTYPSEDVQYEAYRAVLQGMGERRVIIRTLDLGGDKIIPGFKDMMEDNPILGWRAVRFCMAHPDVFKVQIRALLRASVHGCLEIMFPMISGAEELERILALVEEAKEELRRRGSPFRADIPLGIMIEVPSAALVSDVLARKVDFFSIGTNDLIQYMIAVDRGNERIAYLYEPMHLAVLRIIKMVVENAHRCGIPVGMCGEMAADPKLTAVLVGLELDSLSMSSASIPEIKGIIRSLKIREARRIARHVMGVTSVAEANAFLKRWVEERVAFFAEKD